MEIDAIEGGDIYEKGINCKYIKRNNSRLYNDEFPNMNPSYTYFSKWHKYPLSKREYLSTKV